jgi:GATA zinc finger
MPKRRSKTDKRFPGAECAICGTKETVLWRKGFGKYSPYLCNACGIACTRGVKYDDASRKYNKAEYLYKKRRGLLPRQSGKAGCFDPEIEELMEQVAANTLLMIARSVTQIHVF